MQFLGVDVVCKSEHWGFKKAKENTGQCKSGGKDFRRDYAKEQLRENMGQSKSKRSKVLKNCKGVRPLRIKIEIRSNEGCASPPLQPTHLIPLSVCLSILCLFWISSCPQLAPVRFSNNKEWEKSSLHYDTSFTGLCLLLNCEHFKDRDRVFSVSSVPNNVLGISQVLSEYMVNI
jgi:hypothetical protein